LAEPLTSADALGATQELLESEWRMPVIAALFPVNSPDNAGSLLAEAAVDATCQLPVTETSFPEAAGANAPEHPARTRLVERTRDAPTKA
jgi:hypothetical protein